VTVRQVGGAGGLDDVGGEDASNDGGSGGNGRIKLGADGAGVVNVEATGVIQPLSLSRPDLVERTDDVVVVASGETLILNTDGYTGFAFSSLEVQEGGVLTAVGSQPLRITVDRDCTIAGTLDVSGGAGSPGQERLSGAGGGAGGGVVQLSCGTGITVSGAITSDGGAGGRANLGSPDALAGQAGVGIAGGAGGGLGSRWGQHGIGHGGDGQGPGGGLGSTTTDGAQPGGGGGGPSPALGGLQRALI
jgi:hypothetical protein